MTDAPSLPETLSFAEFADHLGVKRSYVTALRKSGRLILTPDEKRVRVAESIQRIEDTRDPSKAAVAARHAEARAAAENAALAAATQPGAGSCDSAADDADDDGPAPSSGFAYWRERSERAKALKAERELAQVEGRLIDAEQAEHAVSLAMTTLRATIDSMIDRLSPELAVESSELAITRILTQAHDEALTEASRRLADLAKRAGASSQGEPA